MSRFYDALKEAGRSSRVEGGTHLQTDSDVNQPIVKEGPAQAVVTELTVADAEPAHGNLKPESEDLHTDLLQLAGIPAPNQSRNVENGNWAGASAEPASLETSPDQGARREPGSSSKSSDQAEAPAASIFQAKTEVAFDPTARLIPHAVDSVVVEHYRRLRTKILQQHA